MRIATFGALFALACAAAGGCAHHGHAEGSSESADAGDHETELDVRDVAGEAKVSLVDAIRAAHAARPGRIVEAELEGEMEGGRRSVFYEVMVVAEGGVFEVKVDPATGAVSSVEPEKDAEEIEEMKGLAATIPAGSQGIGDLVVRAESRAEGARAVKAGYEFEHGRSNCEVVLLRGREVLEADVDPLHPDVATAAKSKGEKEDEDDEEDEDEEDEK